MRHALHALFLAASLFAATPAAHAQTEFQRALQMYEQGTKPTTAELTSASAWAGRTVTPSGGVYGGAFLMYGDQFNPANAYLVERAAQDPDAFVRMDANEMQQYWFQQEQAVSQEAYSPLVDSGDPLGQELTYSLGNGAVRCGVRKAVGDGGVPVYLVRGICEDQRGCREIGTGRPVYPGGDLGIVYVWMNKLPPTN
jgi:hypothetical protein